MGIRLIPSATGSSMSSLDMHAAVLIVSKDSLSEVLLHQIDPERGTYLMSSLVDEDLPSYKDIVS